MPSQKANRRRPGMARPELPGLGAVLAVALQGDPGGIGLAVLAGAGRAEGAAAKDIGAERDIGIRLVLLDIDIAMAET